ERLLRDRRRAQRPRVGEAERPLGVLDEAPDRDRGARRRAADRELGRRVEPCPARPSGVVEREALQQLLLLLAVVLAVREEGPLVEHVAEHALRALVARVDHQRRLELVARAAVLLVRLDGERERLGPRLLAVLALERVEARERLAAQRRRGLDVARG